MFISTPKTFGVAPWVRVINDLVSRSIHCIVSPCDLCVNSENCFPSTLRRASGSTCPVGLIP